MNNPFLIILLIIVECSFIILVNNEWLHLSFKCYVCRLEYSKTLFFVMSHSFFRCPFCQKAYTIEKRGEMCRFKSYSWNSYPIIRPFEVEWKKPVSQLKNDD